MSEPIEVGDQVRGNDSSIYNGIIGTVVTFVSLHMNSKEFMRIRTSYFPPASTVFAVSELYVSTAFFSRYQP